MAAKLIAIDASMHSTGVAVFDMASGEVVDTCHLAVPKKVTGLDCCFAMAELIANNLTKHQPARVAIEGLHLSSSGRMNAKTIINLGALWGMIASEIRSASKARPVVITSNEVAAHLGLPLNANRKRRKDRSQFLATVELYGVVYASSTDNELVQEDVADAIAVGHVALKKLAGSF